MHLRSIGSLAWAPLSVILTPPPNILDVPADVHAHTRISLLLVIQVPTHFTSLLTCCGRLGEEVASQKVWLQVASCCG